jgi:hypothetical protein
MNTQIIENNKLLAEFMGCYQNNEGFWGFENTPNHKTWNNDRFLDCTKYDTDWNWLMRVVEKIDEVCGIDLHEWDEHINNALCSKSLSTTYNACVEFVQWYNNQNK